MRLRAFLFLLSAWSAAPLWAMPRTAQQVAETYPGVEQRADYADFTLERRRVLVLFDEQQRVAAIIADGAIPERLQKECGLQDADLRTEALCSVLVSREAIADAKKRLLGQPLLGALGLLFRQSYYNPAALQADGRVMWASGKRRSLDVLLPPPGTGAVSAVEVVTDMDMDAFAASVFAKKLGYPEDTADEQEKRSLARELHCGHILYSNSKRNVLIFTKGGKTYLTEREATAVPSYPELAFPAVTHRTAGAKPADSTQSRDTVPLTPPQALKAYINRLLAL